jgi:hypothetical protein
MPVASTALAIKYALTLEDTMSPALSKAEKGYTRFTKSIDRLNAKTEKSISRTFGKLTAMVGEFTSAAEKATQAVSAKGVSKRGGLADQVAQGVAKALRGLKIRLSATVPSKKSAKFDSSVNLSRMYKNMPQPPDLVGLLEAARAPKFAKGGLVGGTGGKDKVPALLTAGEWVLTKDQTKDMLKSAGALRDASGAFTSGAGVGNVVKEMKVLTIQADKLREAAESGMDPKAVKDYERVVERLTIAEKKLVRETSKLSRESKIRLAPALKQVRQETEAVTKAAPKAQTAMSKWLKTIASSSAFLAIHTAMKTIQEDFLEIRAAAQEAVGEFGVDTAAEGLVTNFQQMNRVLGLSAEGLGKLRDEFVENSKVLPLSIRDLGMMSEAMQDLVEMGAGSELAMKLTPAIQAFAQSTGVASEQVRELSYFMANRLRMGAEGAGDALAFMDSVSKRLGVSAGAVSTAVHDAYENNEALFQSMGPENARKALDTMARVAAAGESTTKGFGEAVTNILARAATGTDAEALTAASLMGISGMEEARRALQTGDVKLDTRGLAGMDPAALSKIAEAAGMSRQEFTAAALRADEFNSKLAKTADVSIEAGKGVEAMAKFADENKTTFQWLRDSFGNLISSTFPDVLAFFKDLNPLVIISWIYLGSKLLPVLKSLWGTLGKLKPALNVVRVGFTWIARAAGFVVGGVTAVAAAIAGAVAAVAYLGYVIYKHWSAMPEIIDEAWVQIKNAVGVAAEWWGRLFTGLFDGIKAGIFAVGDVFMYLPRKLWEALQVMGTSVADFFVSLPSMIGNAISDLANWLVGKLTAAIPDWVFTALNYAGIIDDAELASIQASRSVSAATSPVSTVAPAAVTAGPTGSNGELLSAVQEMNAHLRDINDNTAEGTNVVVKNIMPRSPSVMSNMIAAGGV